MNKSDKILIVGHDDIIENALYASLKEKGYSRVVSSSRAKLDVLDQALIRGFFQEQKIDYVFLTSTRAGGIEANQRFGAEFMYSNLVSMTNVVETSRLSGVKKLLYLGSSCAYPKDAGQPMKAQALLTGELEKTSEPYAVAKIAGIKLCQSYRRQYGFDVIVAIPATIYGPGMDVDPQQAHVLGALLKKFHELVQNKEKTALLWGSGEPKREFIYASDFAEASIFLMEKYEGEEIMHIGCSEDISIKDLAQVIAKITGFTGKIGFDRTKPDGAMRKLLDSRRIMQLGWQPKMELEKGIAATYQWYVESLK